jgi:hypothetical protein
MPTKITFQNIDVWPGETSLNSFVNVIEDSYGFLWMTSSMGLHRYDGREVRSYYQQADSNALSDNYTEMLFEDSRGQIWVGTLRGAINRYVRETDDFIRVSDVHGVTGHASYMIEDSRGHFWIAAANGLFHLDPEDYKFSGFTPGSPPKDPRGYGFRGLALDISDPEYIWVVGLDGAYRFHIPTGKFQPLPPTKNDHESYMMMDVHQPEAGAIWGGSWFGGLLKYDIAAHQWNQYLPDKAKEPDDLSVVKSIFPYRNGFWVALRGSFGYFDVSATRFLLFPTQSGNKGYLKKSINYHGLCLTKNGNLVIARGNGFSISSPLDSAPTLPPFIPLIRGIEVDGKPYVSDTNELSKRYIVLDEKQHDLTLSFVLPGYYGELPVKYSYWLEGYDQEWTFSDGREARYTNLPRGTYTFRFRVGIMDDQWIEGKPVTVRKEVSFTSRPLFYFLLSGLTIAMIYFIYDTRLRSVRRESKLKAEFNRKLTEMEMSALRAQMNPHFMFNSLNSIKYYILNEEPDQANKYLNKFSKLMRLVLKNSQTKLVNLADELEALRLYIELEALRFHENFNYEINIAPEINQDEIYIPPMIVQPFVENAIWHGLMQKEGPGHLIVNISQREGTLTIDVVDDGIGREQAAKLGSKSAAKKSFGIAITSDRIALVREALGIDASVKITDVYDDYQKVKGTKVHIILPLMHESQIGAFDIN